MSKKLVERMTQFTGGKNDTTIAFRAPKATKQKIQFIANRTGRNFSQVVNDLLNEYLDEICDVLKKNEDKNYVEGEENLEKESTEKSTEESEKNVENEKLGLD
ncbi:MAG: hypothetical protein ACOC2M_03645 [bacterium]